jgi:D-apionolactonase
MNMLSVSAGPLSMMFDRSNAFLRYIRLGDEELVRGVFAAVRDRDWNTVPFSFRDFEIETTFDSFRIGFVASSLDRNVAFCWRGSIKGNREGKVCYRFHGVAEAPFDRNRIGLCVLHPSGCAGKKCRIEHVDGTVEEGTFPEFISPHQPFKNIQAILHQLTGDGMFRVSMTGDTFEMEDQRNWTDASYKTYSTPLDIPFPVRVEPGTEIDQSVTIELVGPSQSARRAEVVVPNQVVLEVEWKSPIRRPSLGMQWPSPSQPVSQAVTSKLVSLRPDHLRVDVWLNQSGWQRDLAKHIEVAQSLNTRLEVAIFAQSVSDPSWQEYLEMLNQPLPLARILVFHTTSKTAPSGFADEALKSLSESHPGLPVVVGTNAYFAELNRGRPTPVGTGQVCYSINPQVHAFDNESLSETLQAQRVTVDSAVEFFKRRVVISPVTLQPRFNPNATSTLDRSAELEAAVDPRQVTGYGAAWTVGVCASLLTHPDVDSVTLYEAFGPRGIIANDGSEYPMTQAIETVLQSQRLFACTSTRPLQLVALGMETTDGQQQLLLGNLSADDVAVKCTDPNGNTLSTRVAAESVRLLKMDQVSHA